MAGFTPDEGEKLIAQLIYQDGHADRDSDLQVGLFTDASPGETITEATISEPAGTGYARITLTDASWSVVGDTASYAKQTFIGGAGGWSPAIYGYFIATQSSGGTPRLLHVEIDDNGPYLINEGDKYGVTPNISVQ